MKAFLKLFTATLAIVLGTLAMPAAAAPEKIFSLAFNPGALGASNPNLMVRIKNESPNGNSSINSIDIVLPSGYSVSGTPLFIPAYSGTINTNTPGHVKITGMSPVKRGDSVFLKLPVNVAGTAGCTASGWDATVAYTGSSLSGDTFGKIGPTQLPAGYGATTTPSGTLSLSFVAPLPTSFVQGQGNSIGVTVASSCGAPPATAVTLSASPTAPGLPLTQTTTGTTTFSGVTFSTLGPVTVTAASPPLASINFTVNVFPFGSLACGQNIPPHVTNPPDGTRPSTEPGYVFAQRGAFNAKGSPCALVNYDFQNQILAPGQFISNAWDTLLQPDAAFFYSVNWNAKTLDPLVAYPPTVRPKVAWEFNNLNQPILTEGLACLSAKLPAPYGRVPSGGLAAGVTSITLDFTPPPGVFEQLPAIGAPFPINVGPERMTATRTGVNSLSLVRGTNDQAHAAGAYVMSTPMPIDPRGLPTCTAGPGTSPYCGTAVRMCIVSHGWQSYSPDPVTGAARYFWVTDAIDNGDGFMSLD